MPTAPSILKPTRRQRDGHIARLLADDLGQAAVDQLREASKDFYWPVPSPGPKGLPVYSHKGEFYWRHPGAGFNEFVRDLGPHRQLPAIAGGGFANLSDLISEATVGGKLQKRPFNKVGTLAVTGVAEFLWPLAGQPGAGAAPAAIAAGTVPTNATAGALGQTDSAGADTLHLTTMTQLAIGGAPHTLMLMDLLWYGAVAMNSTAAQSVTGVPTRYTGAASAGNIMFAYTRTTLPATAHNNTLQYVDQSGNAAESAAAVTGVSAGAATRFDQPGWFIPLNAGDTGVRNITQYTCSALVASGQIDIAVARPLAYMPLPAVGLAAVLDGINSAFNLVEILDGACLTCASIRGSATATTYGGDVQLVSG